MKLYGANQSPFVRKVRVVLEEKGIPCETERLIPVPKTPELLALHPMGKIPILRDGEVVVPDSSVICAISRRSTPRPRSTRATPPISRREVMGAIVFERFVKPNILQQPTDESRVQELLERALPPVMDYLESQLPGDRDSVLARFSIADAALGSQLGNLAATGIEIDTRRWPRTARYYRAVLARPSFKSAMAQ